MASVTLQPAERMGGPKYGGCQNSERLVRLAPTLILGPLKCHFGQTEWMDTCLGGNGAMILLNGILAKYRLTEEWNDRFATSENGEIRLTETGRPCPARHRCKKTLNFTRCS